MFEYIRSAFSKKKVIKKIRVGVCAMEKKTHSKPMKEILGNELCNKSLEILH